MKTAVRPWNEAPDHNDNRGGNWRDLAACFGMEPEIWFADAPDNASGKRLQKRDRDARVALAKSICRECPVRQACLDDAIRVGEKYGIRGGLTSVERGSDKYRTCPQCGDQFLYPAKRRGQVCCSVKCASDRRKAGKR